MYLEVPFDRIHLLLSFFKFSLSLSLSRHFTLMIEQYPYTLSLAGLSIESAK